MGNDPWAGNNSSIIASSLEENSRSFKDLIRVEGLSTAGFFFHKFKNFPGFPRKMEDGLAEGETNKYVTFN